ncbi:MAG: polysaccharide biosynthesis/export family protein [Gammaproteobacteria bacterium]|nr:polysaccharide biosynthesis/export family protein [Gammaproteobacteria bacterium]
MNYIIKYLYIALLLSAFNSAAYAAADTATAGSPAYLLGPGDMLEISVWKEEGLEKQVLVRPDGGISFPLAGEVDASNKTIQQLRNILINRLKKFIPDPVVSIAILKVENNQIYVVGKVVRPGEYISAHYINVMQALAMAGGITAYASSGNIKVLRQVNGKQIAIPFEYNTVAQGENLQQNIILKSGDVVVVP